MFTAKETGITGINLISLFFHICFHSDGDEDEMASPLPTFTQPTPATPASPSHSSTSRKRSAPVLATQPASKKHWGSVAEVGLPLLSQEKEKDQINV